MSTIQATARGDATDGTGGGRSGAGTRPDWERLVGAVRVGEPGAWDALLVATRPLLHAAVRGMGTREDQRDAVQDSFELIVTRLHQLNNASCYPGWVRTMARRAALRYIRAASRETAPGQEPVSDTHDQEVVDRVAVVPVMRDALALLPAKQRRIVLLLASTDRPNYARAARTLAYPVGTLGPTRQRALDRLRRDPRVQALAPAA